MFSALLDQPFQFLGVDPTATREQIQAAFELAKRSNSALEEVFAAACEVLTDPLQRLPYELTYPLGCPISELDEWRRLVSADVGSEGILQHAAHLSPLSQANFFAYVAAQRAADAELLFAMTDAHGRVELTSVYDQLKETRRLSGYPLPPLALVNEALERQLDSDCQRAILSYGPIDRAPTAIVECVQQILETGQLHQIEVLKRLLAAYRNATVDELSSRLADIEDACDEIEKGSDRPELVEALAGALDRWVALCCPLLLHEGASRVPDEVLQIPLQRLRSVIIDLALNARYERAIELARLGKEKLSLVVASAQLLEEAAVPAEHAVRTRNARELASRTQLAGASLARNVRPKIPSRRRTYYIAGILTAVCAVLLPFEFEKPRLILTDTLARSFSQRAENLKVESSEEEKAPAVGRQQHLALANLRYCKFQEERLRLIKPKVKTAEDTRAFNLLAVDYNSRCSDFLYRDSDDSVVHDELVKNRQRLATEADQIVSGWHGRVSESQPNK